MIIHVDMDAFYASVEMREQPALAGKPVVVGGREARGVVAAASYAARHYGVRSAMPIREAKRRCPGLICLPVRMQLYSEVSQAIHAIFMNYTPEIEPLSLDEAFLDVTASEHLFGSPQKIARQIKQDILEQLRLVCSVGIAKNKFIAKIASDINKPDGFVSVAPERSQAFLDPLPVSRLWGAGQVAQKKFQDYGISSLAEVRHQSQAFMLSLFGKAGQQFLDQARGIDNRQVETERQTKSISHETTFNIDVESSDILTAWLFDLTEQVSWRLRNKQLQGRSINLKLRYPNFKTITRSYSLDRATQHTQTIWQVVHELLQRELAVNKTPIRLLGMGVSNLSDVSKDMSSQDKTGFAIAPTQLDIFQQESKDHHKLDDLADKINTRFGAKTLRRGRGYHS